MLPFCVVQEFAQQVASSPLQMHKEGPTSSAAEAGGSHCSSLKAGSLTQWLCAFACPNSNRCMVQLRNVNLTSCANTVLSPNINGL